MPNCRARKRISVSRFWGVLRTCLSGAAMGLLLLGIAGPLCIGLVNSTVTSSAVRPLAMLADSLERLGKGDLDTPFPPPRLPDETDKMLELFEKTRVILKASLQRRERDIAAQQHMRNELEHFTFYFMYSHMI